MDQESRIRLLAALEAWVGNPEEGLPQDLFRALSRLAPLVNVDLLIRDERLGTLLTWRHDENYGPGWHIPGGIIRYKETAAKRIRLTAREELGADVEFDPEPACITEAIDPVRRDRGHLFSLLYRCRLVGAPAERLRQSRAEPEPGQWAWHRACPANLIPEHDHYRRFL
jgi:colanic acid biosynthesis protein WcaH